MIPAIVWVDIMSRSDWSVHDVIVAVQRETLESAARRCESKQLRSASASNEAWDAARRTCSSAVRDMKPVSKRDEVALLFGTATEDPT